MPGSREKGKTTEETPNFLRILVGISPSSGISFSNSFSLLLILFSCSFVVVVVVVIAVVAIAYVLVGLFFHHSD